MNKLLKSVSSTVGVEFETAYYAKKKADIVEFKNTPKKGSQSLNFLKKRGCCKNVGLDGTTTEGQKGSLGLEHKTPPMPAEHFLFHGDPSLRNWFVNLKRQIAISPSEKCGIHVHVDRSKATRLELLKVFIFTHSAFPLLSKLGGGQNTVYAAFLDDTEFLAYMPHAVFGLIVHNKFAKEIKLPSDGHRKLRFCGESFFIGSHLAAQFWDYCEPMDDKYYAINFHKKYNTYEFRFPRSTSKFWVYIARTQLCIAIVDFCRNAPIPINKFCGSVRAFKRNEDELVPLFLDFVKNKKEYAELNRLIDSCKKEYAQCDKS